MPGSVWSGYTAPQNNAAYLEMLMRGLQTLGSVAQQYGQDQTANKLMNTNNPPRASLVAAPAPGGGMETPQQFQQQNPGVAVTGTAPFTGGAKGMQMQMELNKQNQTAGNQNIENQLRMAQIQNAQNEIANRDRAANFNYPQGADRFTQRTPTPKAYSPAQSQNGYGLEPSLTDANGQLPEHVRTSMAGIYQTNQSINAATGADLESFEKANGSWKDNGDGTWTNPELSYKFGKNISMDKTSLDQLRMNGASAYAQYKMLNQSGYSPVFKSLFTGQADPRQIVNPTTPNPMGPGNTNIAGSTGKTSIGQPQQQQPIPSPLTGSQFINSYIQQPTP